MSKYIDITGQKFNRLTAIKRVAFNKKEVMWLCVCDCGNEHIVTSRNLRHGKTKSCGCLLREHGFAVEEEVPAEEAPPEEEGSEEEIE